MITAYNWWTYFDFNIHIIQCYTTKWKVIWVHIQYCTLRPHIIKMSMHYIYQHWNLFYWKAHCSLSLALSLPLLKRKLNNPNLVSIKLLYFYSIFQNLQCCGIGLNGFDFFAMLCVLCTVWCIYTSEINCIVHFVVVLFPNNTALYCEST